MKVTALFSVQLNMDVNTENAQGWEEHCGPADPRSHANELDFLALESSDITSSIKTCQRLSKPEALALWRPALAEFLYLWIKCGLKKALNVSFSRQILGLWEDKFPGQHMNNKNKTCNNNKILMQVGYYIFHLLTFANR